MTKPEPIADAGPSAAAQRTSPLGLAVNMLRALGNTIVPLIAVAVGGDNFGLTGALAGGAMLAIVLLAGLSAWLSWWRLTYTINPEDIRIESGVLSREARSIPFERIQDVSLEQKLLARIFGLAEVKFETGAGGGEDGKLAFVSLDEGERLRELVKERREDETATTTGLSADGETDGARREAATGEPIFAMDERRLFTFGLFEFSLVVFAVLLGAAQQFEFLIPFDIWDLDFWSEELGAPSRETMRNWSIIGGMIAILSTLTGVVLLGMTTGVVRTFLRDWGFRLDRTPKGFRRRRGMLTLTDVVLPVHRVQAAVVRTGIIRRRFGWHGLKFVSLAQDVSGSSSHDVAPFAKLDEIWPIAAEADIAPPDAALDWRIPNKWRWLWEAAFGTVIVAGVAIGMQIAGLPVWTLLILLLIPLTWAIDWFSWRRHRHAIDARQVYGRKGLLAPKLTIAPQVKLQSVEIRQGPIGRMLGYVDLHFGLAGGSLSLPGLAPDEAYAIREAVAASIATVDFSALPR